MQSSNKDFTHLLHKISLNLTEIEIKEVKFLGRDVLTEKDREDAKDHFDLMELLQRRGIIGPSNLQQLVEIFRRMEHQVIVDMIESYERNRILFQPEIERSTYNGIQETPLLERVNENGMGFNTDAKFYASSNALSSQTNDSSEETKVMLVINDAEPRLTSVEVEENCLETDWTECLPKTPLKNDHRMKLTLSRTCDSVLPSETQTYKYPSERRCSSLNRNSPTRVTELRNYQLELAQDALNGSNSIICAPAGCGKTWIAGFICQQRRNKCFLTNKQPFRALFIVCGRTLVSQQKTALREFFGSRWHVGALTDADSNLQGSMLINDMVVLTPQKLLNSLNSKTNRVNLWDITMLIMDECHHTEYKHPYNDIMNVYHKCKKEGVRSERLPQIIGLTASLGVGTEKANPFQHYIKMCANLDCFRISHVRDPKNRIELNLFIPNPLYDKIIKVDPKAHSSPFYVMMNRLMKEFEHFNDLNLTSIPPAHGSRAYKCWISEQRNEALRVNDSQDKIIVCDALEKLNMAWMLCDDFRIKDAKDFLDIYFNNDEYLPEHPRAVQQRIFDKYAEAQQELQILVNSERIEDCPQVQELCKLLDKLYGDGRKEAKGILLAQTGQGVISLLAILKELPKFRNNIFAGKFVGQRGQGGMTQVQQENVLRCFKSESEEKLNLLVTTDVAQEGLDLPRCNFVIRFNFVGNEISYVRSRGRARAPNSELYLIVTRGSTNEARELENPEKQHLMQEALQKGDNDNELKSKIREQQEINLEANIQQAKLDSQHRTKIDVNAVSIHCSKCKSFLCSGNDLRQREIYCICVDESFPDKVHVQEIEGKEFHHQKEIGEIFCNGVSCLKNKLGRKLEFKQGIRPFGFVLGKDGCVWNTDKSDYYMKITQWSKVPFCIQKEDS